MSLLLEQGCCVELVRCCLVRYVDNMYGEAGWQAIGWKVVREERAVRLAVGGAEPRQFRGVASGIDEQVGCLRLTAEGVHFQEIDVGQRLTDARIAQPLLPAAEHERHFSTWVHRHELVQSEDAPRRVATRQPREVDLQIPVRLLLGYERRQNWTLTFKVIGDLTASFDVERHCYAGYAGCRPRERGTSRRNVSSMPPNAWPTRRSATAEMSASASAGSSPNCCSSARIM